MGRFFKNTKAFTLVELMLVVAVIGILAAVVIASLGEARKKARDSQRISDLTQLQVALRAYKDVNEAYPAFDSGTSIGSGGSFDSQMSYYFPRIPRDPLNSDPDGYFYYYDSSMPCSDGLNHAVVFARKVEKTAANWGTICDSPTPGGPTDDCHGDNGVDGCPDAENTYGIILN